MVRDCPAEPVELVADRHMLIQIITNLLSNARHAVMGGRAPHKRIAVRMHLSAQRAVLEIEDNGCGIAAEHVARIFTHGFTTKADGHGFGLHSAACAATDMGGSLSAHSDGPGEGARFTLDLPLLGAPRAQPSVQEHTS